MTIIKAVASAITTVVVVLALAVASNELLDTYFRPAFVAPPTADDTAATADSSVKGGASGADGVAPSGSPCIDARGEKRNWPWANAPTLWPRCEDDASPSLPAKKEN
jgi:hypothetical protein